VTIPRRIALDVTRLPSTVFGARDMMWWGTLGFIIIEGFTLLLCAAAHVYLRKNFAAWPPEGTPRPAVLVPTIQVVVMLVSLVASTRLARAAHGFDLARTRTWLTVDAAFGVLFVALRVWELTRSLNVRWDSNAYGSAQWLVVGAHGTLIAIAAAETIGMAMIFWLGPIEKKHFSDAADVAFYDWFIVLSWLPLYVLCFLLPYGAGI
jgi:heme/copper-type cytochrome/quinol oxidase subunit 3